MSNKYIVHYGLHRPGNAGDTVLFVATRDLINKLAGRQTWQNREVHSLVKPEHVERINREAKAVVIGGGGLFLRDTNLNPNSGWQWNCPIPQVCDIKAPIIVFGAGYNRFRGQPEFEPVFLRHVRAMARRTVFWGMRHKNDVKSIQSYLHRELIPRIMFQPCPTVFLNKLYSVSTPQLKPRRLALNMAFDRENNRYGDNGNRISILSAVAKAAKYAQQIGWHIDLVTHCGNDAWMEGWLDQQAVKYNMIRLDCRPSREVLRYYQTVSLAIGMRGHAQMIPFGLGIPFISLISHNKLRHFLSDIGQTGWGVEVKDGELQSKLERKIAHFTNKNNWCVARVQIGLAQEELWKITKRNLKRIKKVLDRR